MSKNRTLPAIVQTPGGKLKVKLEIGDVKDDPERNRLLHFLTRMIIIISFLFPLAFISTFFATLSHEVLGHGLAAELMGGSFDGMEIHWTGQGLAHVTLPGEPYGTSFIFLAGIFANLIIGFILLRISLNREIPYFPRLVMTLLATDSILSASVYVLWNAMFKVDEYDISRVLALADSPSLRIFFVGAGLILTVGAVIIVNYFLFRILGEWLNADKDTGARDDRYRVVLLLAVLFLADSSRWATNTLLLKIGLWSVIVMIALSLVVLGGIYYVNPQIPKLQMSRRKAVLPIVITSILAVIAFILSLVFFNG